MNMLCMVVTSEVSQLEMSALKLGKFLKSWLMSVTAETRQSAMAPYFAVAKAAFELYSQTAVCREALSAKVPGGGGGENGLGGGGGGGDGDGDGGGGMGGGGMGGGGDGMGIGDGDGTQRKNSSQLLLQARTADL